MRLPRRRGGAERGAGERRPHRRRRHHLAAAVGERPAEDGTIEPFEGDTAIFITPGYRFRAVDILLTNFHLPRSTLFMLVSAFSGLDAMKRAYAHAIVMAIASIRMAMPACCFARLTSKGNSLEYSRDELHWRF